MKQTVLLLPYNSASEACKVLAEELGIKRIKLEGSRVVFNEKKTIINWGNTTFDTGSSRVINSVQNIKRASNKSIFFDYASKKDVSSLIPFTSSTEDVINWVSEGSIVFARTVLSGHSGEGIVEITKENIMKTPKASLFTKYIPKKEEFRLHISNGKVFLTQRKAKKKDSDNANYRIRNLANGFIYARSDIKVPNAVDVAVKDFIDKVGNTFLDFYALDVIYNEKQDKAYILEANSAPGLSGSTVKDYAAALREYF